MCISLLNIIKETHVRDGISGLPYLLDCMQVADCRGLSKSKRLSKSWLNDLNGEDDVSRCMCTPTHPYNYKDCTYCFRKTFAIFTLLTNTLMLTKCVHQYLVWPPPAFTHS